MNPEEYGQDIECDDINNKGTFKDCIRNSEVSLYAHIIHALYIHM